jgi:hypothetical protein
VTKGRSVFSTTIESLSGNAAACRLRLIALGRLNFIKCLPFEDDFFHYIKNPNHNRAVGLFSRETKSKASQL